MSKANESAYPIASTEDSRGNVSYGETGLTKLELFSAMAMQGYLAGSKCADSPEDVAEFSVDYARALITELEKQTP